jgi:hypothetical protein
LLRDLICSLFGALPAYPVKDGLETIKRHIKTILVEFIEDLGERVAGFLRRLDQH